MVPPHSNNNLVMLINFLSVLHLLNSTAKTQQRTEPWYMGHTQGKIYKTKYTLKVRYV